MAATTSTFAEESFASGPDSTDPEEKDVNDTPPAEPTEPADDDEKDGHLDRDRPETDRVRLDEDPETSLVGSIYLHLLSEHDCYAALAQDDAEAVALHTVMHQIDSDHDVEDWRFRPKRTLATALLSNLSRVEPLVPPA